MNIPSRFDLASLDSVQFIGTADSVGNVKANLRLSEKRARNTQRFCKSIFKKDVPTIVLALGEKRNNAEQVKNRRVDIVLHQIPYDQQVELDTAATNEVNLLNEATLQGKCYKVDCQLLNRAHLHTIIKRKKQWVMIETGATIPKRNEYYTASKSDSGKVTIKTIKWRLKKTGSSWWAQKRWVAKIPQSDFDQFKVFTISEPPCTKCNQPIPIFDFPYTGTPDTCERVATHLMQNLQVKRDLFDRHVVKIRVPKEYVDSTTFFTFNDDEKRLQVQWKTKKGKRHQHHLFSELPVIESSYISNIRKYGYCCPREIQSCPHIGKGDDRPFGCGGVRRRKGKKILLFGEAGGLYQNREAFPYTALGINASWKDPEFSLLVGTNTNLDILAFARFKWPFWRTTYASFNPLRTWQDPAKIRFVEKYVSFYLGTEIKMIHSGTKLSLLEQNLHLGVAAINDRKNSAIIPRVFLQSGIGHNSVESGLNSIYPVVQVGINFKIAQWFKPTSLPTWN